MSYQDNIVVCCMCGEQLYHCDAIGRDYCGDTIRSSDFHPVNEKVPQPKEGDNMVCPFCGDPYHYPRLSPEDKGTILKLVDDSWWPHPPVPPVKRLTKAT